MASHGNGIVKERSHLNTDRKKFEEGYEAIFGSVKRQQDIVCEQDNLTKKEYWMKIDFDDGVHIKKNDAEICEFYWRNPVAAYYPIEKRFHFFPDGLLLADWENYPEDALDFINWIRNCQEHKDGIYRKNQLYSVEIF